MLYECETDSPTPACQSLREAGLQIGLQCLAIHRQAVFIIEKKFSKGKECRFCAISQNKADL